MNTHMSHDEFGRYVARQLRYIRICETLGRWCLYVGGTMVLWAIFMIIAVARGWA
jgi:hypothetical protein